MQTKRIKRVVLSFLLLSVLYNLLITSLNQWKINLKLSKHHKVKNHTQKTNFTILGTHLPMPSYLRGKKLPFHQVFEPRQVGFRDDFQVPRPNNETKIILLWTRWNAIKKTINYYFLQSGNKTFLKHNCPNPNCIATFNRKKIHKADAVLFHLIDIKMDDLPTTRNPRQIWILYNMEPPWQVGKHMSSQLHLLNNLFNWTMSYRSTSHIVVKYGFIMSTNGELRQSSTDGMHEKSKSVAWFVSDCMTNSRREDYVKELGKYIDIDIYGKCGNNKCYPSQSSSCYEVLEQYKFYLSFENAICKDYVTEKFFNIFNYDIVPVVFGGANYSAQAPKDSFIDATLYPQPKLLAETLINIAGNKTVYDGFLKKKSSFKAYLDPWMCKLCNKLHSQTKASVVEDVEKWFFKDAQCKSWDNKHQSYVNTLMKENIL